MAFVRCRSLNIPAVIMLLLATTYLVTLLLTSERHAAGELNSLSFFFFNIINRLNQCLERIFKRVYKLYGVREENEGER